jgi:hypothetical protein
MEMKTIQFKGHFEEQTAETAQRLQVMVPEDDTERDLLSWSILQQPQFVEDDNARTSYVFGYELGKHMGDGVFVLKVTCRDASGRTHAVEIAAALAVETPFEENREHTFTPLWLLSERVHFKPLENASREQYHGPAFGHLDFGGAGSLPHRRLFGATV